MLYGLVGAHRSGKTTLAKSIAEELGIDFHATSITQVAKRHGFDPVAPMSLKERVRLQYALLEDHVQELERLPRPLIVDRTPLDMLAYMTGEFTMVSHLETDQETLDLASAFYDKCVDVTRLHYDYLYYLCPLTNYVVEEGKPAPNLIYQKHIASIIRGALASMTGELQYAVIEEEDFEFRREWVHDHLVARIDEIDTMRRASPFH